MEVLGRTVVAPDPSACEAWLAAAVRALRAPGDLRAVHVVVPTNLLGRSLVRSLVETAGEAAAFHVRAVTLSDLAADLLGRLADAPAPLPPGGDLALVRAAALERLRDGPFGRLVEADSPGLARTLLSTLTDLRAALVEPAELRAFAGGSGPAGRSVVGAKWRAVADSLEAYEAALADGGLLDRVGIVRAAAEAAGRDPDLAASAGVLLAGLHEATPAEAALLRALRPAVRGAFVFGEAGLPPDEAFEARTRWDRASFGLRRLLAEGLGLAEAPVPASADAAPSALAAFRDRLLRGAPADRALGTGADGPVRLVSAPSEAAEVAEALRAAFESPDVRSVAILARDRAEYAEAVRDAAAAAGIPFYARGGFGLAATAEGQAALALLALLEDDDGRGLDRRAVIDLAMTAPLAEDLLEGLPSAAHAGLWDGLSAEARVVRGRRSWDERLEALERALERRAAAADRSEAERGEATTRIASARALRAYVGRLDEALGRVAAGDLVPWSSRAGAFAKALRTLLAAHRRGPDGRPVPNDRREEAAEALETLEGLDRLPGAAGRCSLETFVRAAREAIEGAPTRDLDGAAPFGACGLFFGDLAGGRFLPFDAVAVVGVAERQFPRPPAADPILPDAERAAFGRARAPGRPALPLRREKDAFDAYLLGAAASAARRLLVVSVPRIEPSAGRERLPSVHFLRAWRVLRGLDAYPDQTEVRTDPRVNVPASAVARAARLVGPRGRAGRPAVSAAEIDLAAAATARGKVLRAHLEARAPHAAAALAARAARRAAAYGPYDGIVPAEESGRPFSPTALEEWFRCPYAYLARRRLRLKRLEKPEEVLATEPTTRGTIFHAAARAAALALLEAARRRGEPLDSAFVRRADVRRSALEAAERAVAAAERDEVVGNEALWRAERREILAVLDRLLETGFLLEPPFRPPGPDFLERAVAFDLDLPGAGRAAFRGTIDRIETEDGRVAGDARPRAVVIDYKTGRRRTFETWRREDLADNLPDPVAEAAGVQIPLYLEAVRSIGLDPVRGLFIYPYRPAAGGRAGEEAWPPRKEGRLPAPAEAADLVAPAVRAIRAGLLFPVPGERCDRCDFVQVCGPRRFEVHERKDAAFRRETGGHDAIERAAREAVERTEGPTRTEASGGRRRRRT